MKPTRNIQNELNKLGYMGTMTELAFNDSYIYVEYLRFSINKVTIEKIKNAKFEFVNIKNDTKGFCICLFKSLVAN